MMFPRHAWFAPVQVVVDLAGWDWLPWVNNFYVLRLCT